MRTGISITVTALNRERLEAILADRNAAQKHVWRARIVLLPADGAGANAIMRQTGKPNTCPMIRTSPKSGATLSGFDPPAHAIVLSVDEKSQIQALDRAQPGRR